MLTSTPIKGVLLGAAVTAVIQSSSATTVMTVGFVNSGIMQLKQAVGIIMGANLGTTVTAWILSLTGIEGSSFLAQMCKPSSFSPILAFIGIICLLFSKNDRAKNIGTIFLGFTVLMYGMAFMTDAVSPLAENEAFIELLVKFSNPILGVLAGAIFTAILQSSSASVGILQALAITGVLPFTSAVPIIMGQNIGTCITALLSSIGTSKNAKRVAFVHLYFNVIGTAIFLGLFYAAFSVFDFTFMRGNITATEIAIVHTIFNVIVTFCLLPFTGVLEKLARATIKEKKGEAPLRGVMPEELLLATPGFAVEHCKTVISDMISFVEKNVADAVKLSERHDESVYTVMREREKRINEYESRLNDYMLKLSQAELSEKDAHEVSKMLNAVNDLERISDHALNVARIAKEKDEHGESYSRWGKAELAVYNDAIMDIVKRAVGAYRSNDINLAKSVQPLEETIDGLRDELKRRHIRRLQKGDCTIKMGLYFIDTISDLERISDYSANLAGYILHANDENFDTHRYMLTISEDDRAMYCRQYEDYRKEFALPDENK
jgi:phosphate:Na+ symporter